MFDQWDSAAVDRRAVVVNGLLPAGLTLLAMAVSFSLVGGLLLAAEGVVLSNLGTRVLALGVMYLLPQFVVGLWMGARHGLSAGPPLAAGFAPVGFLVLALGAFGGPIATPFGAPLVTAGAVLVWTLVCACGLVVGARVVAPRL
jgi:hypothetical protein